MGESKLHGAKWYVLKVVTGQEKKVRSYIEAEFSRESKNEQELQVLIPSEKVYEVRAGKKRVRERYFFPGYMLIYADLESGSASHTIATIPGVLGFLSSRGWGMSKKPMALRESEINKILGKVEEIGGAAENIRRSFVVGESVKVIDGPFNGFVGNVQEVFEDRKKVNVTVKVFGRNTPIELSYVQVEKIN